MILISFRMERKGSIYNQTSLPFLLKTSCHEQVNISLLMAKNQLRGGGPGPAAIFRVRAEDVRSSQDRGCAALGLGL